jgi:hypothetical protein
MKRSFRILLILQWLATLPALSQVVDHFVVQLSGGGIIPNQTVGIPFFIQVLAKDTMNATVTSFQGNVEITSTQALFAGGATSEDFTNGVLASHLISAAAAGPETLSVVQTAGTATGTSNGFIVFNPSPSLSALSATAKTTGEAPFTLSLTGTGFVPASTILLNGGARATTYSNSTTLTTPITSADLSAPGIFVVTVINAAPGGGTSNPETLWVSPPIVKVKVFLEAAYQSGSMKTTLRSADLVPLSQPYTGAPWNYLGTEHATTLPANTVDWLLLELRTTTAGSSLIARRAALLKSDGTVTDTDGSSPVAFPTIPRGVYYVVVRHRNHLAVMTASALTLDRNSALYNFSAAKSQFFGNDAKNLGASVWGMYAGDFSLDGFIDSDDFAGPDNQILQQVFQSGYLQADLSMDGFVDSDDFTSTDNNFFKGTQVPH